MVCLDPRQNLSQLRSSCFILSRKMSLRCVLHHSFIGNGLNICIGLWRVNQARRMEEVLPIESDSRFVPTAVYLHSVPAVHRAQAELRCSQEALTAIEAKLEV